MMLRDQYNYLRARWQQRRRQRQRAREQRQTGLREGLTTNRLDPRLRRGVDDEPGPPNPVYLVLDPTVSSLATFKRPVRQKYRHVACQTVTTMSWEIAETFARNPLFYGATYCAGCRRHLPVEQFRWLDDDSEVGT